MSFGLSESKAGPTQCPKLCQDPCVCVKTEVLFWECWHFGTVLVVCKDSGAHGVSFFFLLAGLAVEVKKFFF